MSEIVSDIASTNEIFSNEVVSNPVRKMFGKNLCNIIIDMDKVYFSSKDETKDPPVINTRLMSFDSFISTVKNIDKNMSTPILPPSCFAYSTKNDYESIFLFSRSERKDIKYYNGDRHVVENVLFPSLVLKCSFYDKRFHKSWLYAVKDVDSQVGLTSFTLLHRLKLPNVYSDSSVCWGNSLGSDLNLTMNNCSLLIDIFKSSEFNNDLFNASDPGHFSNLTFSSNLEYFKYLSTIESWQDELLGEQVKTLKGLISEY